MLTATLGDSSGLSINILYVVINHPCKDVFFFKNSLVNLLVALRFLGGRYNFCNFVITFLVSLWYVEEWHFTDLEMIKYYRKTCD